MAHQVVWKYLHACDTVSFVDFLMFVIGEMAGDGVAARLFRRIEGFEEAFDMFDREQVGAMIGAMMGGGVGGHSTNSAPAHGRCMVPLGRRHRGDARMCYCRTGDR